MIQPSPVTVPTSPLEPVASFAELVGYFGLHTQPPHHWRIGLEHEKVGVRSDGRPIPFDGSDGLWALLKKTEELDFVARLENGHPVEMWRGDDKISLEPGGQVEMSAGPASSMAEAAAAMRSHLVELRSVASAFDIRFIAGGFRPFGQLDDVQWQPKRRYEIMRTFLPEQGRQGRLAPEMMKRTATVQFNFDFSDEVDAAQRMRMGFGVSPLVTALSASSPFVDGKPSGYLSYRAAVWLQTDENRCGVIREAFLPDFSFAGYAKWALDVPMFFIVRQGRYITFAKPTSFRQFWQQGVDDGPLHHQATIADWELHLSTVFPEVRLKKTVEMRGADAAPLPVSFGLGALWRGLVDDPEAREAAWQLVAYASVDEREAVRREVPHAALQARLGSHTLADLAPELVRIAAAGLSRLAGGEADAKLLDPIAELAASGRCPAQAMLEDYDRLGGDPAKLIDAWEHQ